MTSYVVEAFTPEERAILEPHFSSLESPVFALTNLPEVVKGALFARYSRTTKSLRRLFLDEFAKDVTADGALTTMGEERAEKLYERVFVEYGDDSVAQLGGVHLACEQASQLLTRCSSGDGWPRTSSSRRATCATTTSPAGGGAATFPPRSTGTELEPRFARPRHGVRRIRPDGYDPLQAYFRERFPQQERDSDFVYRQTIRAKACDTLRGLLPAATRTNVGHLRDRAVVRAAPDAAGRAPAAEMREYGALDAGRAPQGDPGVPEARRRRGPRHRVVRVLARHPRAARGGDGKALLGVAGEARDEVTLVDHDPDGEVKVVAAAMYASSGLPDDQLLEVARGMTPAERAAVLEASVGDSFEPPAQARPGRGSARRTGSTC